MKLTWPAYRDRTIRPQGSTTIANWRLKVYDINCPNTPADPADYQGALNLLAALLPQPPVTRNRIGMGFIIAHPGAKMRYLVGCWWDNQNELVTRVFVCPPGGEWQPAGDAYSFCVWDLEVMWFERNRWVDYVLTDGRRDPEGYMKMMLESLDSGPRIVWFK